MKRKQKDDTLKKKNQRDMFRSILEERVEIDPERHMCSTHNVIYPEALKMYSIAIASSLN